MTFPGVSLRPGYWVNLLAVRVNFPAWFDHLEEGSTYREVHCKNICSPQCENQLRSEDVNETPTFDVLSSQATVMNFIRSTLVCSLNFVCGQTCAV